MYGLVITSFPHFYHPSLCNAVAISFTWIYANGVASLNYPFIDANFDDRHSIKWPIVILDGIQCGLIVRSGEIPVKVNGRSSYLYVIPQVPFYPCLLQNLSPIYGILNDLTLTLTNLYPF